MENRCFLAKIEKIFLFLHFLLKIFAYSNKKCEFATFLPVTWFNVVVKGKIDWRNYP